MDGRHELDAGATTETADIMYVIHTYSHGPGASAEASRGSHGGALWTCHATGLAMHAGLAMASLPRLVLNCKLPRTHAAMPLRLQRLPYTS